MSSCGWIIQGGEGAVLRKFIQRPRLLLSCCSTSKFVLPPWLKLAIVMSMPIVSEKGSNFILRKWLRNGTHCFYSHSTGKNPSFTVTSSFKGGWRMTYLTGRRQKGGRRSFSFKGRERETGVGHLCHRSHPLSQWLSDSTVRFQRFPHIPWWVCLWGMEGLWGWAFRLQTFPHLTYLDFTLY